MSGYIVDDGDEINIVIDGVYSQCYWLLYSDIQRRRNQKVLKQLMKNWEEVEKMMRFYISMGVETNSLMERVSKIYLLTLRNSNEYMNDMRQRQESRKSRIKKLNKIRQRKEVI